MGFAGAQPILRVADSCGASDFQPEEAAGVGAGFERAEVVDALADADGVDRDAVFLGERDEDAALRGAVELGHDDAGDPDHRAEDLCR